MFKNHLLSRLLLSVFMIFVLAMSVKADQLGDFTYTDNGAEITIDFYTGLGGAVTIPGTIDGKPVTSIGNYAFYNCSFLTSITLPDSIVTIGSGAFEGTGLANVTIGAGVTRIVRNRCQSGDVVDG